LLKAYSDARNRCYLHPHRQAEIKCDRCKTGLCAECARPYQDLTLCEHCRDELELAVASKPTFRTRLTDSLIALRNGSIVVVVAVAVCAGLFFLFRPLLSQPISPEEFARFRYAVTGSFQTPEGINLNSTVLNAKIVAYTSDRPGFEVKHLINEYTGTEYPGWRSTNTTFPQDVVVEHDQEGSTSKVILYQHANEPPATMAKDFEIDVSDVGPNQGFQAVGRWQLAQTAGPQKFTFPPAHGKWIRLRILSNYGSADYTSLDEFDAYAIPPGTVPSATVTP
jgi:hypothetical protein